MDTNKNNKYYAKLRLQMLGTEFERMALLGLAKEQLYYKLNNYSIPDNLLMPIYSLWFYLNLGVFVTLLKEITPNFQFPEKHIQSDFELRGCIGTLETDNDEHNIISNIKKYVLASAFEDKRFNNPVSINEFSKLKFAITILDKMNPITFKEYYNNKFILGKHGLLLKLNTNTNNNNTNKNTNNNKKQGYFLPSVAHGKNKTQFLNELCVNKAGGTNNECSRIQLPNAELYFNEGLEIKS
jgi:uncharacterized protein (TIGR00296 family)